MLTTVHSRISRCKTSNRVSGFTLLELLTVIVVGGILAAISMPYFFSRAIAAKQAEGKMLVSTMNRSQQTYFTQNGRFSNNLETLALSLHSKNYDLLVESDNGGSSFAANYATSKQSTVKSYVGSAMVVADSNGNSVEMQTVLCEANVPGAVKAATPTMNAVGVGCASGTRSLN